MPQFRKKPVTVDAVQWPIVGLWPPWIVEAITLLDSNPRTALEDADTAAMKPGQVAHIGAELAIATLEGVMFARPGDWIIRGTAGELYPCKPDIFADIYEATSDDRVNAHCQHNED
jgi:hypothetical protein